MEQIINKVANSGLIEFNLEDLYNPADRICIDIKDYLVALPVGDLEAYILKEKYFREKLNQIDFVKYQNKLVNIVCTVDAIVPTWAYMLLSIVLTPLAKKVVIGSSETMENILFSEALSNINGKDFLDAKVVIKGCNKFNIPVNAYADLCAKLKPYAKSIMYGEPCSTVPLYKKAK